MMNLRRFCSWKHNLKGVTVRETLDRQSGLGSSHRPMTLTSLIRWRILWECRRPWILRSVDWLIDSIFGFCACAFALYLGFYSLVRGLLSYIPIVFTSVILFLFFPLPLLCYGSTTILSGLASTLLTLNYVFDIAFCVNHISIAPLLHCLRIHNSIPSLPPAS